MFLISEVNANGDTALHLALKLPNFNVIEKILEDEDAGKLAGIKNYENLKPIQLAVRYNKIDAVKKLFEASGSCETLCCQRIKDEMTDLLHIATEYGHLYLANLIIEFHYKKGEFDILIHLKLFISFYGETSIKIPYRWNRSVPPPF